jgi:hypothetical protein
MKTFIIFIIYILYNSYISDKMENIAYNYYNTREKNNKTTPKVYDIAHKFLPNLNKYNNIHHIITTIFILPILLDFNILQEFLGYWIVIFIIRSITILVTILPKHKECQYNGKTIFHGLFGGCYDKIFSGHFASVFLATLLYLKYNWINLPILILINLINSIFILLVRGHYTIDLIVALFITLFVYQNNLRINKNF